MTRPGDNLKADTAAAYAAAADHFDHPALGFWDRFGRRTLDRIDLRPGGTLALTIWGADLFEPASGLFWEAVHAERPDVEPFRPWTRLTSPEALDALFERSGIPGAGVVAEPGRHPLAAPEDWWTIVHGSGYRAAVDAIGPEAAERVRTATLAALHARLVREITADVVYGVAAKPGPPRPGPP